MCGIAGSFSYDARACEADHASVQRMCDRMACRGPDGDGLWCAAEGRVVLGHRRLAILDLSARGAQPMVSADGTLAVTFNGEIYNYRALRSRLESRGHRFTSGSDTEVLLALYAERGPEMVHDLRGMFAFALWDGRRRGLFMARDPFGMKPLYLADQGGRLRFASEVKALRAVQGVDTSPDPAGQVGFFLWGSVPDPYTMYRGIRALPAGSTLWLAERGRPEIRSYASPRDLVSVPASGPAPRGDAQGAAELGDALRDSVRHHLEADVDVGVFLSAGVDSATIASLAAEAGGRLRTVTLGFSEFRGTVHDEAPLAEQVARSIGSDHHTVWITRADFERELPRLIDRMDQPTIDGVNGYFVSQAAAHRGIKVVLSGLGGDELFNGYPGFRHLPRLVSLVGAVPAAATLGRGFRVISAGLIKRFTSPKYAGLLEYGGDLGGAYLLRRSMYAPWELPQVLDPDLVRAGWEALRTRQLLGSTVAGLEAGGFQVNVLDATWYMKNTLLRDTDWASMSHSVEVRVPLVDLELWRVVARQAAAGRAPQKKEMVQAARGVPGAVLTRPKTGFSVPTRQWMSDGAGVHGERGLRGWARHVYHAQQQG